MAFFTRSGFILGDEEAIETDIFLRDDSEVSKFIEKILEKFKDHRSIFYTGNVCRYFEKFKRVNRAAQK